jgi:hypothetical protein
MEMLGNLGDTLGVTPISSSNTCAGRPMRAQHLGDAGQAARVAHAQLRRAEEEKGVLEAGRMRPVEIEVARHEAVRADLDFALVVDVERREAGLARPMKSAMSLRQETNGRSKAFTSSRPRAMNCANCSGCRP